MKTLKINALIVMLVLLTACNIQAQFSLSTAVGYGIKSNSSMDYTLFNSSIQVNPQYDIDKINISAIALAVNDSIADFYSGIKTGYQIWEDGYKKLQISAAALAGFEGKLLTGGGVTYTVSNTFLNLDCYYEKKRMEFWTNLSVGIFVLN